MNVKETNNLKEDSTTNGPQATVSQMTQTSIKLLLNGVQSLMSKVTNVNPNYEDTIDWKILLTTIVENLHAVLHFKHKTFDALQFATDFDTRAAALLSFRYASTIQCHRLEGRSKM